jgi:nitrite reductase (NADH) small subunit/3-phenylpropionate/trans-cinnamate dioxygenase ferredoxin subunit
VGDADRGGDDDDFVTVARVADVAPGTATAVVVGSHEIALFNVGGTFYALDNTCPHQGGPLAEGWIDGTRVTCPWHAWTFELADGSMTLGDYASVDPFDVRVRGDEVQVSRTPRPGSR